jgi:hypothetical protein
MNKILKFEDNTGVVAIPLEQLVNESIMSTEQYTKNAIPLINNMAEEFYQRPNKNTWSLLTDLFEGIQWIIQSIAQINSIKISDNLASDNWEEYIKEVSKLNYIIPELENAIINKDNILIGDMLLYEIIPVFENMEERLGLLLSGADKDVK